MVNNELLTNVTQPKGVVVTFSDNKEVQKMLSYHSLLEPLYPGINPAGIEAYIRLEHPVIRSLKIEEFLDLAEKAVSCEHAQPGFLDDLIGRENCLPVFARA